MKIVYLHQYFNTPAMAGSTRSFEMARRWVRFGHDVHVVTTTRGAQGVLGARWRCVEVAGIQVHDCGIPYSNEMPYWRRAVAFFAFAVRAAVRARSLRGDAVFATSTPLTIFLPAWFAVARRPTPLVFEVRDLWPAVPIALGALKSPLARRAAVALERAAYRRSESVIALSPGMADGVRSRGGAQTEVVIAPNSADVEMFGVPPSVGTEYRQSNSWLGDRPMVVYCGTIGLVNGLDYAVRLAREFLNRRNRAVFAIYGDGRDAIRVRRLAESAGVLDKNFLMFEAQSKSMMPVILSAATVCTSFVIPVQELEQNSANKFFDALAAGRPVAINHGGWQADLIAEHDIGVVLDPHDISRAADSLESLLASNRLSEIGANARALAYGQFSRDEVSARVLCTLERAVARVDGRPGENRRRLRRARRGRR